MYDHSSKAFFNFDATWFRLKTEPVVQTVKRLSDAMFKPLCGKAAQHPLAEDLKHIQTLDTMKETTK